MRTHSRWITCRQTTLALGLPLALSAPSAEAQSISYALVQSTAIPTLGEYALLVLALLLAGAAYWRFRRGTWPGGPLAALLLLLGSSYMLTHPRFIDQALAAGGSPGYQVDASMGNPVPLNQGLGLYQLRNNLGAAFVISGLNAGTECSVNESSGMYAIYTTVLLNSPGCELNSRVEAGAVCYALLVCVVTPEPT